MQKVRNAIISYPRWTNLETYLDRIDASRNDDFSLTLENIKSLLESVCKEICSSQGVFLSDNDNINKIVKETCNKALNLSTSDPKRQIASSLITIGQQIGELRNDTGLTSHGRTMEEIQRRNDCFDAITKEFLIDSVGTVILFLIHSFENLHYDSSVPEEQGEPDYRECSEFNDSWDEQYGEFSMGDYSYTASEILYNVDVTAYHSERRAFEVANAEEKNSDEEEG